MRTKNFFSWQTIASVYKFLFFGIEENVTIEDAKEYTKYLLFFWSLIAISGWMEGGAL